MSSSWNRIREAPARLGARTRARLSRVRSVGRERLRTFGSRALEGADGWVDRAEAWPGVGRLAGFAGRLVDHQRERWGVLSVAGWDTMNARDAVKALAELDAVGLRVARQHEAAGRNRVTVIRAIDQQLAKRAAPAVAA